MKEIINNLNVSEKFSSNKSLIIFQTAEIKKTEDCLLQLEECFLLQINNLKRLHEKEQSLKEEIIKRMALNKAIQKIENCDKRKSEIFQEEKAKLKENVESSKIPWIKVKIPQLKDRTVHKMVYEDGLIIGGSHGLLMRYYDEGRTFIYETNTESDIVEIIIQNYKKEKYVISFTKQKILAHSYRESRLQWIRELNLAEIRYIFYHGEDVSIIPDDTMIKRFNINYENFKVVDIPTFDKIPKILHRIECDNFSMFNVQDRLLHKIGEESFTDLEVINIFKEIKRRRFCDLTTFVCCSHKSVWIINEQYIITYKMVFENNIKIMERYNNYIMMVDELNNIVIYSIYREGIYQKRYEQNIGVNVQAINMTDDKIFVAAEDGLLFIIIYKC